MSTGIRILPRDTKGYVFDGILVSYQAARSMQEHCTKIYPEAREQMARDAKAINGVHLRRLLTQATWGKRSDNYWLENLPREIRGAYVRTGFSNSYMTAIVSDDYVAAIDKDRRAIAKSLRHFTGSPATSPPPDSSPPLPLASSDAAPVAQPPAAP